MPGYDHLRFPNPRMPYDYVAFYTHFPLAQLLQDKMHFHVTKSIE